MNSQSKSGKLLTIICILFPILFIYSSGVPGLTIADVLLLIWLVWAVLKQIKNKIVIIYKIQIPVIIVFCYLLLMLLLEIIWGYPIGILLKLIRYLAYFVIITFFSYEYIDFEYALKLYVRIAIVSSIYLIFQAVAWNIARIKISGIIPFLNIQSSDSFQIQQLNATIAGTYRPCAFFAEPAHFASVVIGCLGILLYKNILRWSIVVTVAILLSSSSTGIICSLGLWITWFIFSYIPKANMKKTISVILIIIGVIILILINSQVQLFISRTVKSDAAINGRMSGYTMLNKLTSSYSVMHKIIGIGMIDISDFSVYLPGILQFLIDFGYAGFMLLCVMLINSIKKMIPEQRIMIICMLMLSLGTMSLVSYLILIYFGIAFSGGTINHEGNLKKSCI